MILPRTALVTGAARRLGAAFARGLARRGFAVALHCRESAAEAHALAAEIEAGGGRAAVLEADLADLRAADSLVERAAAALGPVGLLVNNASLFRDDRAPNVSGAALAEAYAVNCAAPIVLAQALARALPQDAEGLVVNLLDQRVLRLRPQFLSYAVAKSGLYAATAMLAQALAPRVRVVGLAPGPVFPNETEGAEGMAREIAGLPLERGPEPEEFLAALDFLLAARSVTGQTLAVDGGQHIAWRTPDVLG
jgi:NAD(P)-dependent dehydrogenase (short-subunit alcohol dehydrogenase family)